MAVANAVPLLKQRADIVTAGRAGEGVSELIAAMIADDLASFEPKLTRHRIPLGDARPRARRRWEHAARRSC